MIKKLRYLCTLLLIAVASVAWGDEVTISYSGSTANMTGGNDAALVGLNASEWSVVSDKGGGTNHVGLNKDGSIRLYWNENGSSTLTVSSLSGARINSITLNCKENYDKASVSVNGTEVIGNNGEYEINASSFVIGNANTSNLQVRITSVVIDYTPSLTPTKKNPTVTIGTTTIEVGGTTTVTTNGPELTLATSDDAIASISGNTVKGIAAGTATITATWSENAEYLGGTETFDITVKDIFVIQDGVFDFTAGENYGSGYESGNVKVQSGTWTAVNVTMAAAGRNCWYNGTSFRLYKASGEDAAGTMTFAVPSGKVIKKILFDGSNTMDQVAASTGSYTVSEDLKTGTWEGSANSVTFTAENATKTAVFNVITVTYGDGDEPPVVVVPVPTFNPEAGEVEAGTTVEIICPDGADGVEYSFDKSNWTEYTTPIEITEATTIYAQAYDEEGNYSEVVSAVYTIKQDVPAYETVTLPYEVDFTKGQEKFKIEDKTLPEGLNYVWSQSSSYGMKASAYVGNTNYASESWLVSPLVDLSENTGEANLAFEHAVNFFSSIDKAKEEATVWVREEGGSWSKLSINYPETLSWSFVQGGTVDLSSYNGKKIQVGFKYVSTTEKAGTWEIKNFNIIAGEVIEKQEAGLSYDVESFTATIGEENEFPVLNNPHNLTGITYRVTNESYATIDATTGDITLVAPGQTTVYAKFDGNDDYKECEVKYVLVVKEKSVAGTDKYELVTDASTLAAGDIIIIVDNDKLKAISTTQNPNNRAATDVKEEADGSIIPSNLVAIIELGGEVDAWTFKVTNGETLGYLYAAGATSNNYLRTQAEVNVKAQSNIAIDEEGLATVLFNIDGTSDKEPKNKLRYNNVNGGVFACYGTSSETGDPVRIYRKVTSTETHSGNVNGDPDGKVDIADVTALVNIIVNNSDLTPEQLAAGDFDNSGTLTVEDVEALVNKILGNQ